MQSHGHRHASVLALNQGAEAGGQQAGCRGIEVGGVFARCALKKCDTLSMYSKTPAQILIRYGIEQARIEH